MAALRSRCGHYIFILWFLLLSSFFLVYSQRLQIRCLPYFHTWCSLSVNLECRSEMCCMRLAGKTGRKKSPSTHHRTTLLGCIFATRACIDNRKKVVKQQYLLHMSPRYGERRSSNGWDRLGSLEHPSKFQRGFASCLRYCGDVANRRPTKLCTMFGRLLGWYTMYTFSGVLAADGILPCTKFTLRPTLAFSYIGSVTARHTSSGREPSFVAWYKEWNYVTFAEAATCIRLGGHHGGHRPTF